MDKKKHRKKTKNKNKRKDKHLVSTDDTDFFLKC